jgi:cystinosin
MTKTRSLQLDATSIALGWCYCILWSFSFYPQIILNYRRKSVVGFSLDFALFNFLGFLCYTIYTCSLKWNPAVREQYFTVYKTNLVTLEDCLFALHGLLMCALTCYQCIFYERAGKRNSNACLITASIITMCCIGYLIAVISGGGNGGPVFFEADSEKKSDVNLFSWLCFVYLLSTTKIGITFVKYTPQVLLNIKNKSTYGFSMDGTVLDLLGSIVCVAQVMLDGATLGWSGVAGNPMKLTLALVSALYDTIFMAQFLCIYGGQKTVEEYSAVEQDDESGGKSQLPTQ